MKKIDLSKAMLKNKNCLGFIWRFKSGRYGYQNDNDLGLDLEAIKGCQKYVKKIFIGKYYIYQVYGGFEDDGTGAGLATIKALLKDCHHFILPLTSHEKRLVEKYYGGF